MQLLTRRQAAETLARHGYPIALATLAAKATRGGGPPFRKFGSRALYEPEAVLDWARQRLSGPINSTSEAA